MATKNFFCTHKKINFLPLIFLVLSACSGLRTRDQGPSKTSQKPIPPYLQPAQQPQGPISTPVVTSPVESVTPPGLQVEPQPVPQGPPSMAIPKVGLILGPGGARTFAEIGVLQEFQREKIPVVAVAGIEWGAPIAALYSNKGLANEAEWQMSKLKSDDIFSKSIIGGRPKPTDAKNLDEFLRLAFGNSNADSGKLPFVCPALNLPKDQTFLMSRGQFTQMLPYCMAYPPTLKPYQGNVAAVRDIKGVADYLRNHGATVIVMINVLPAPNTSKPVSGDEGSAESVLWNEISAYYSKPIAGVDHVLHIPLGNANTMSFDDRRQLLQKGSEAGAPLVRELAHRLGL